MDEIRHKPTRIRRLALLGALLVPLLAQPGRPALVAAEEPPSIESLLERADPRRDDWPAEQLERATAAQLDRLAAFLSGDPAAGLDALLAPKARATLLAPDDPETVETVELAGGFAASRAPSLGARPTLPARDALARLGQARPRVEFHVVGVDVAARETRVRYEAAVTSKEGRKQQQVAYWVIAWNDASPPRVRTIVLDEFQRLEGRQALFHDATRDALVADPSTVEQLADGGGLWSGRIDALGESNLMGHQGLALGDVNGDGLEDLYVAMGTGLPDKLFVRQPDGRLVDEADARGVAWLDDTKGVLFADTDNDGDQDLLFAIGPTIVLGKNDGQGSFERFVSMRAPTAGAFYSLSVADYDRDGDLDVYGVRYVRQAYGLSVPVPFHDANNGPTNHLLRNDGEDRFVDVTRVVGLDVNNTRFSLAAAWSDYDLDGDVDLYVSNDFGRNNLYRNDGERFVDVAAEAGVEDRAAGMGVSWGDYDLDGDLDLYVTNMYSSAGRRVAFQPRFHRASPDEAREAIRGYSLGNTLLANLGDGTFEDRSDAAGVRVGRWGWGGTFADLNNDGYDDLVVPNGFLTGSSVDDL